MNVPPKPGPLAALGRLRRVVVATLVACAALSWTREAGALPPALASAATPVGVGLGVAIVAARQWALRAGSLQARARALAVTYATCAALGLFGTALALAGDDGSRGVLFAVGGAIFALGTPPRLGRA